MYFVCFGIHLHIWSCNVWSAINNCYIQIWHVGVRRQIGSMWLKHIMFWHLNAKSWCKHCLFACKWFLCVWGYIFTYGFAMYGVQSTVDTFRFDMFALEGKLGQCDSNILYFDIWMRIHNANIVISYVNVFCLFEDTSSHMVLQCMKCNQELQHWDLTCLCLKANGVNVPQTYSYLTYECEFMMLTLSFRMYMFFVCLGIHLHIWICNVWSAIKNRYIDIWNVCVWKHIAFKRREHIMFWHLNAISWCIHCLFVCQCLRVCLRSMFTFSFAMDALHIVLWTYRLHMFVLLGKLKHRDVQIYCLVVYIVFWYV